MTHRGGRKKSPGKSPTNGALVPQKHGGALRHGSLPGNTPGTGRPPDEFKAALATLADDAVRKGYVSRILEDPGHQHFMRALEWATDRGYGKVPQNVEHKGEITHGVLMLPPLGERRDDGA